MQCPACGHDNPNINRFCGMCGGIMDRRRLANSDNLVAMPARTTTPETNSGTQNLPSEARKDAGAGSGLRRDATKDVPQIDPDRGIEEISPERLQPATSSRTDREFVSDSSELNVAPRDNTSYRDESSFSIFGVNTGAPRSDEEGRPVEGLHGPSFLGLGEDAGGNSDYLLDEEDSGGGGRKLFLFAVLLLLGALGYMQYRNDTPVRSLWTSIRNRATGQNDTLAKNAAPDSSATDAQPMQPTDAKPSSDQTAATDKSADSTKASTPAATGDKSDGSGNSASDATSTDTSKLSKTDAANPKAADQSAAANTADNADATSGAKSARGKETPQMTAKARHPESDRETADQQQADEEEAPAKSSRAGSAKPSPSQPKSSSIDEELVTHAQSLLYARGGAKNCGTAMSLLKQAAGHGSSKASSQLGAMYATGNCAPFDRAEAYRWFSRAAESDPRNTYLQQNRDMLWREMSAQERRKVLE